MIIEVCVCVCVRGLKLQQNGLIFNTTFGNLQVASASNPPHTILMTNYHLGKYSAVLISLSLAVAGRGTIVTGRIDRGKVRSGDSVELLGFFKDFQTTVSGG